MQFISHCLDQQVGYNSLCIAGRRFGLTMKRGWPPARRASLRLGEKIWHVILSEPHFHRNARPGATRLPVVYFD
jgi:hypothetical protein